MFTLLMVSGFAAAQDEEIFTDSDGQYTVPVPTNWTTEEDDGFVVMRDPDSLIAVYLLVAEAESAEAGIAAGWALVDAEFALESAQSLAPPSAPGVDETFVITYDTGDEPRLVQGVGQRIGELVYVLLIDGELNALMQRNAQIQIIATGFTPLTLEQTDLSEATPLTIDDAIIAELEAWINDNMPLLEVPGAAVAIVQNGELIYTGAFGVKSLDGDEPIDIDTQFMVGSTGKPMTTTMMATLVDDGIIDWDTPVIDVLPNFAVADAELTEQFTLQNLVCACTGVPRRDFELIFNASELSAEAIVASLQSFEFFTDFGEAFQYSNQLVATGGYAAGAALNPDGDLFQSYLDAMQTRLFDPLAMTATTFDFDAVIARGDYAIPHGGNLDGVYIPLPLSMEQVLTPVAPAGASWSTVGDMAQYMIAMLNRGVAADGARIVSEENLLTTWQPQVSVSADSSYGLGWFVDEYKGVALLHHGGNTLGFTTDLAFLPDAGVGIVVLTNAQASNIFNEAVRTRLLELIYEQPNQVDEGIGFLLEQVESAMAELEASVGDAPAESDVTALLGSYLNEALGEVELRYEDDALVMDAGEFIVELRPNLSEDAEPNSYLLFSAPASGVGIRFEEDGFVLGASVTEYTFERSA
jgi:CubicO group peptidase (beta-lactamase class C family)